MELLSSQENMPDITTCPLSLKTYLNIPQSMWKYNYPLIHMYSSKMSKVLPLSAHQVQALHITDIVEKWDVWWNAETVSVPQTGYGRQLECCYSPGSRMGKMFCWICQMKIQCSVGSLLTCRKTETFTKSKLCSRGCFDLLQGRNHTLNSCCNLFNHWLSNSPTSVFFCSG